MCRTFDLACPEGNCLSEPMPSCQSEEWETLKVAYVKCQEINFNNRTFLCGEEGTKRESRKSIDGVLFDVDTTNCSDCGDLAAAFTWSEWLPCDDKRRSNESESFVESKKMCRRRGNTQIGSEEEQQGKI